MLKKPIVAIILCLLIVLSSTVISVHSRLDSRCAEVSAAFSARGGIRGRLGAVSSSSADIIQLADDYGLDVMEIREISNQLIATQTGGSPSDLAETYGKLIVKLDPLIAQLEKKDLSASDAEKLLSLKTQYSDAKKAIEESAYNNTVSLFLHDELGSFSVWMAKLCGVQLPEQFQ